MKKIVPIITCEIPFCQYVCKLVFGVDVFDLDFRVQMILSNNQSRATLWVLETCLIVGLLPLMIIFNHGFVIFKKVLHRAKSRKLHVRRDMINIAQNKVVVLGWNLRLVLDVLV